MTAIHVARRLQFCAGHRVHQHESKCRNLHGHNYVAFFHAFSPTGLDVIGRVIDFGVLKQRLGAWIEENWDHGVILWKEDTDAIKAVKQLTGQKLYVTQANPTAENLARELLTEVAPRVLEDTSVTVTRVVLWETENCCAEVAIDAR
ncbi:6-pyruvoyl trahydropterin synthase family protein [Sorangium sp. So ce1128]